MLLKYKADVNARDKKLEEKKVRTSRWIAIKKLKVDLDYVCNNQSCSSQHDSTFSDAGRMTAREAANS